MTTMQQMNFRLVPQVKAQGDQALARHGLTPSAALRAFYQCLAHDDWRTRQVLELIEGPVALDEKAAQLQTRRGELEAFQSWVSQAQQTILEHSAEAVLPDVPSPVNQVDLDKAALRDALVERMEERGLL